MPEVKDKFNTSSAEKKSMARILAGVSSFTTSVCSSIFCMGMYVGKQDASDWWLYGAIFSALAVLGSGYEVFSGAYDASHLDDQKGNKNGGPKDKGPENKQPPNAPQPGM